MSISWASKLAIAFIRPFRSYIDGYNLFRGEKSKIEADIRSKIEAIVEGAKKRNPYIDEERLQYTKECLIAINMRLIDNYDKSYGSILAEVLDQLTLDLESEIKTSFSNEEQQKLLELISNPVFYKLLQNEKLFGLLKKSELDLEYKLRLRTMVDISNDDGVDEIKNLIRNFKNSKNKENSDFDFPSEEDDIDDDINDFFN